MRGSGPWARWWLLCLVVGCGDDLPDALVGGTGTSGTSGTGSSSGLGPPASTGAAATGPSSGSSSVDETTSIDRGSESSGSVATASTTELGTSGGSTTSVASTSEASTSEATTTGDPGDPVCIDDDLGSFLITAFGDTSLAADDWDPPCAPALGGPDRGHLFTAPVDGFYAFDTLGTMGLDTVLYLYPGDTCAGPAIACNDDAELGEPTSRVSVFLPQDAAVVAVVDGYDATQAGPYALDIDAVIGPCAAVDLGAVAMASEVADSTAQIDKLQGSCVNVPGRDVVFRWVAPVDGVFTFDTIGSSFDTVLYLRQGQCSTTEIACNDDSGGSLQSMLVVGASAGAELTVVVDGYGLDEFGALALHITQM
ncbi:hypothetical protein [Paraliomyxa miuraensis]|uniref:hypothetical protein n=1 Tax=Paraliomyxa miuraensis TaxID=376150 RepID=UPI00224E4B20|nr:hypothetical protein [Paraliomyxa miuraensis]MCX4242474.1 hypothetical protein [Paraliomyxa miuraensis]